MNRDQIASLPKVVLHEHLDGGLRPATVIDLADLSGYDDLPTTDPHELTDWFDQRSSGSLVRYLESFTHTIAVMQTPDALSRVAAEAVSDLAADGVVYAEIRFAPSLHTTAGLSRGEVIRAVLDGVADAPPGMDVELIVDAMRQDDDALEVARVAVEFTGSGVVGFDLAGPERGFPASRHADALRLAVDGGLRLTIHAGEAAGLSSITDALDSGAERIGHGVRIVDDCVIRDGEIVEAGPVATRVVLGDVTLEVCPTSNVGTGAYGSVADHPIGMLVRAGFPVTVNTDNRLMSRTSMTDEMIAMVDHHGLGLGGLAALMNRAAQAAFCDETTRDRLVRRLADTYEA